MLFDASAERAQVPIFAKCGAKLQHFLQSAKFFLYFCTCKVLKTSKMRTKIRLIMMKKVFCWCKKTVGLPMVVAGVVVLVVSYFTGLSRLNSVLLLGLLLVLIGTAGYVWKAKRGSKY